LVNRLNERPPPGLAPRLYVFVKFKNLVAYSIAYHGDNGSCVWDCESILGLLVFSGPRGPSPRITCSLAGVAFSWFWTQAPVVLSQILAVVILIVTIVILSYLFCLILLSTLLVPLLLPLVVDQNYPGLLKGGKASFSGCLVNAGLSFLKYSLGLVLTLPLWLLPGMAFFLTAFWNGYLAGQVFPVDVLDGWATVEEQREIRADKRVGHFSLGLITSMLFFVPVINLCAPALMALAFIHYDFQALSNLRKRSLGPAQ
jgi:CysZ protein